MAKKQAHGGKGNGETLQIAILTLFMMGGCFALISGVLKLFLVPARADEVRIQAEDLKKLSELLDKSSNQKTQMWDLRRRVREAEKAQGTKSLKERVEEQLGSLQYKSFPSTSPRPIGNTIEHLQKISLKEAPLQEILSFIARIKQANPSVQVGAVTVTRANRSRTAAPSAAAGPAADDDRWLATLSFYLYTTGTGKKGAAAPAPAASAPQAAEELLPESEK